MFTAIKEHYNKVTSLKQHPSHTVHQKWYADALFHNTLDGVGVFISSEILCLQLCKPGTYVWNNALQMAPYKEIKYRRPCEWASQEMLLYWEIMWCANKFLQVFDCQQWVLLLHHAGNKWWQGLHYDGITLETSIHSPNGHTSCVKGTALSVSPSNNMEMVPNANIYMPKCYLLTLMWFQIQHITITSFQYHMLHLFTEPDTLECISSDILKKWITMGCSIT